MNPILIYARNYILHNLHPPYLRWEANAMVYLAIQESQDGQEMELKSWRIQVQFFLGSSLGDPGSVTLSHPHHLHRVVVRTKRRGETMDTALEEWQYKNAINIFSVWT